MLKKLSDIADVRSGHSFRGAISSTASGALNVVLARDVDNLYVDAGSLTKVADAPSVSYYLQEGDVVLSSRGSFRAGLYRGKGRSVATSALFTIRIRSNVVVPEYLAIYLNSGPSQYYLRQSAKGATIQSVLIGDLKNLMIPCIPLEKQRVIIDLYDVIQKQQHLLQDKKDIMGRILKDSIRQTLEGAVK
jgi:restriction endonuclease S subunit